METPSFDCFADFVRNQARLSAKKRITPDTQFERDLGITGDDGGQLLLATEKTFGICLHSEESGYRETFHLSPNEYLFNSEGWDLNALFSTKTVRAFTVGELFNALTRAMEAKAQINDRVP